MMHTSGIASNFLFMNVRRSCIDLKPCFWQIIKNKTGTYNLSFNHLLNRSFRTPYCHVVCMLLLKKIMKFISYLKKKYISQEKQTCCDEAYEKTFVYEWNYKTSLHLTKNILQIRRQQYRVFTPYSSVFYKTVWLLGPAIPVCSTNKTDRHDINEILLSWK